MSSLQEQLAALQSQPEKAQQDSSIATQLRGLVAKVTGGDAESITTESSLVDDLHVSSLDFIEIAVRCEQQFGVKTEEEAYRAMRTFGDLLDYCTPELTD
ncbi:MAG: acyl carrier protein [Corynebacterium sp.]|uniref:acyl carrier protein n=1 Tax=Corynebacterium sp. TaxID=1720 RepID=UPI0026DDCC85|nr:acyl carrier protein [Corynebacterium sp.]MDO5098628.1 acyl carrier protein [Corynebacterium sp.]